MCSSITLFNVVLAVILLSFKAAESASAREQPATINSQEWVDFKALHGKTYSNTAAESKALYYYNYNKKQVAYFNHLHSSGQRKITLSLNQFSDMRQVQFNALFPKTTPPSRIATSDPPVTPGAPNAYTFVDNWGITIATEDQGTVCNSGWAYATAKAVEILQAVNVGPLNPDRLSAQNLIDCAGGAKACVNQVPHSAFTYLVTHNKQLFPQISYANRKEDTQSGMCLAPNAGGITLTKFSAIKDTDDTAMMRYVGAGYPVVIEFDPTSFDFMHYKAGIFDPPRTAGGSHYMVVTGYGTDASTKTDFWLVQNSFNTTWGDMGTIRIVRNAAKPLAKSAFFPLELGV